MPRFKWDLICLDNGPYWHWFLLNILPLDRDFQYKFLCKTSLKERLKQMKKIILILMAPMRNLITTGQSTSDATDSSSTSSHSDARSTQTGSVIFILVLLAFDYCWRVYFKTENQAQSVASSEISQNPSASRSSNEPTSSPPSSSSSSSAQWWLNPYEVLFRGELRLNERLEWTGMSHRRPPINRRRQRRQLLITQTCSVFVLLLAVTLPFLSILVINKLYTALFLSSWSS